MEFSLQPVCHFYPDAAEKEKQPRGARLLFPFPPAGSDGNKMGCRYFFAKEGRIAFSVGAGLAGASLTGFSAGRSARAAAAIGISATT